MYMPVGDCTASQALESDCAMQMSYSILIFMWFLPFIIATAENSASQWCDFIERNVAQANV